MRILKQSQFKANFKIYQILKYKWILIQAEKDKNNLKGRNHYQLNYFNNRKNLLIM